LFSLSLHHETAKGKAETAAQGMFSSESALQARCPSLKEESRSIRKTCKNSTKSPIPPTVVRHLGKRLPSLLPWFSGLQSVIRRALQWERSKHRMQSARQRGWHTRSMKAQITVTVLLLSAKTIHAKIKSTFHPKRERDAFGSHSSGCKSRHL